MSDEHKNVDAETIKRCCTKFYENDLVAMLLGENFHPGGEKLTLHLGEKLGLNEQSLVLDVACGAGASAVTLAKRFDCRVVVGIDLSEKNLAKAKEKAFSAGLSQQLTFMRSDAETIKFDDETFDAVICECALCTFPDIKTAVSEMYRVLKKGGNVGITDVTIANEIPQSFKAIIFHAACISGALSAEGYQKILREGGFDDIHDEDHGYAIQELIENVDKLLYGWEIIRKFCDCDLERSFGITPEMAKSLLHRFEELKKGTIGYGLFTGIKGVKRG